VREGRNIHKQLYVYIYVYIYIYIHTTCARVHRRVAAAVEYREARVAVAANFSHLAAAEEKTRVASCYERVEGGGGRGAKLDADLVLNLHEY
jgi:hypothetical protein